MSGQICLLPKLSGLGGMVSFQAKFIQGLTDRGISYNFDPGNPANDVILVIGGTRQLWGVWRAKRHGVPVYQRLNGMNWMHRVERTPLRASLKAEMNNLTLAFIRRFLADGIIYQSAFSRDWWNRVHGEKKGQIHVVHNGVDLDQYTPLGTELPPKDHYRILLVEGHLTGSYARGVDSTISLLQALQLKAAKPVELMVVGEASDELKEEITRENPDLWVSWRGVVPREEIPAIDRSAHLLFSTDINAACPNSVIEALACGLPVLAYDTGALSELVQQGSGRVVPYGADYWKLEQPEIEQLAEACLDILQNNEIFRKKARQHAISSFGLDKMVESYLQALEN